MWGCMCHHTDVHDGNTNKHDEKFKDNEPASFTYQLKEF